MYEESETSSYSLFCDISNKYCYHDKSVNKSLASVNEKLMFHL